jgi:hypothetical protein
MRVLVTLSELNGRQVVKLVGKVKPVELHEASLVANYAPAGIYLV